VRSKTLANAYNSTTIQITAHFSYPCSELVTKHDKQKNASAMTRAVQRVQAFVILHLQVLQILARLDSTAALSSAEGAPCAQPC
jgi:hypothetical protein